MAEEDRTGMVLKDLSDAEVEKRSQELATEELERGQASGKEAESQSPMERRAAASPAAYQ